MDYHYPVDAIFRDFGDKKDDQLQVLAICSYVDTQQGIMRRN